MLPLNLTLYFYNIKSFQMKNLWFYFSEQYNFFATIVCGMIADFRYFFSSFLQTNKKHLQTWLCALNNENYFCCVAKAQWALNSQNSYKICVTVCVHYIHEENECFWCGKRKRWKWKPKRRWKTDVILWN